MACPDAFLSLIRCYFGLVGFVEVQLLGRSALICPGAVRDAYQWAALPDCASRGQGSVMHAQVHGSCSSWLAASIGNTATMCLSLSFAIELEGKSFAGDGDSKLVECS